MTQNFLYIDGNFSKLHGGGGEGQLILYSDENEK